LATRFTLFFLKDPEHPYTLEQLKVVQPDLIWVEDTPAETLIRIEYTPTVPHCSLATLIGASPTLHSLLQKTSLIGFIHFLFASLVCSALPAAKAVQGGRQTLQGVARGAALPLAVLVADSAMPMVAAVARR